MKIQTMSIVCGTTACNARCPFCVSKMTPASDFVGEYDQPNWYNFNKACQLARIGGATTVLITGKGEPTLYPGLIVSYLHQLKDNGGFPFVELQTNGIRLMTDYDVSSLRDLHSLGLTTICLSAVHYESRRNREIYSSEYPSLTEVVPKLHDAGFTVRLSIMMMKGYIEKWEGLVSTVQFCKENKIEQLTMRPITRPHNCESRVAKYVDEHKPTHEQICRIDQNLCKRYTEGGAMPVLHLSHGAVVYDFQGQNLCWTNCLTTNLTDDDIRQIIFYPNGRIAYDWKYKGAILL